MSTAAQILANQENATHSTGPITEEGKAASAQNHFKHGFCAHFRVLEYESTDSYQELITALQTEHQPATPTENILVDRMAQHHWLSQRAQFLQSSLFTEGHFSKEEQKLFALYLRYQSGNDRAFSKCLTDLVKLRSEKRKQEIGFEREKQRIAEETRKQESHEAKTRLTNARANHQELDTDIKQFIEARLPGHTEIPFSALKTVLALSIQDFAAELDANPNMAKTLKAA
jgi:hypothetical protein